MADGTRGGRSTNAATTPSLYSVRVAASREVLAGDNALTVGVGRITAAYRGLFCRRQKQSVLSIVEIHDDELCISVNRPNGQFVAVHRQFTAYLTQ